MVCQYLLYNKVNQLYIYIYPHFSSLLHLPPTLPIPPLQVDTKHQADLPVLCSCFPLAIILHLVVYICQCYSLTSSELTLSPPHVLKSMLYICIFIPVLPLGSSEPFYFLFRFHIYVFAYSICFSLSDLLSKCSINLVSGKIIAYILSRCSKSLKHLKRLFLKTTCLIIDKVIN